jgi:hypothetical protein
MWYKCYESAQGDVSTGGRTRGDRAPGVFSLSGGWAGEESATLSFLSEGVPLAAGDRSEGEDGDAAWCTGDRAVVVVDSSDESDSSDDVDVDAVDDGRDNDDEDPSAEAGSSEGVV